MPAAPLGVRRTLTAEGHVALTRWLLQRSVTLLEGAFRMGREKLGWRCGLGSLLFLLTPHKHVRVRSGSHGPAPDLQALFSPVIIRFN